mgnify:CR=1 FL=1
MGRLHLFEFNDQTWMPDVLRDAMTGYLETISRKFKMHEPMTPVIQDALDRSGATQIVDLCSGGAGPLLHIHQALKPSVPILLTDKFPNATVFKAADAIDGVTAITESIDARDVPADMRGLRTIFNGLHHFQPSDARAILADAWDKDAPIVIIEIAERTVPNILSSPLILLFTLIFMPMVRPTRWQYWLFTYLIPIIPLLILWDGLVSHLRVYSPDELRALTKGMDKPGYRWEVDRLPIIPGAFMTLLRGIPTTDGQHT